MARKREELRRRREQLGLTQEAIAQALGVATSSYRGWELGTRNARVGYRPRLAKVLQVSEVEVQHWFDKNAVVNQGMAIPGWLGTFALLEQGASRVWAFEPMVVPGLLQTADYAVACQSDEFVPRTVEEVGRFVEHRLARQAVLTRQPHPLELAVVIDESVLIRPAGDRSVMAGQLRHLADLAGRPNIDIRVLPLDAGFFTAAFGSFTVLTSPWTAQPYMALTLDRAGAHYLDRAHDVDVHVRLFSDLQKAALSSAASVELFRTVIKERYYS